MDTFANQKFSNEIIQVDGKQFTNCIFQEATFVYAGGQLPHFVNCRFDGIALHFTDKAVNTLKFLSGIHGKGFSKAVEAQLTGIRERRR